MEMSRRGDAKMRLINWFLELRILFWGFLDILGEIRNKIQELGIHRLELGRACICSAQNLRKWIYLTWNMKTSLGERFLCEMRPSSTFTSHKQPSPEIWFEPEHFEILSLSDPRLRVLPVISWAWNGSRAQISWVLGIFQVYLESIRGDEQNP